MKKKMTTVTFNGTPEQEQKLDAIVAKYGKDEGAIMRILQDAQEVYGLPRYGLLRKGCRPRYGEDLRNSRRTAR